MMENQTNIGYVNINNETIFEVGRFAILWNVFENTKCNYACSCENIIQIKISIEQSSKEPFGILARELNNRANKVGISVDNYVNTRIYPANGARISNTDRTKHMPIVSSFISSGGDNELVGALLAIFRIRNNMFHGLKGYSELDEQIQLFKAMNAVLEEVIK